MALYYEDLWKQRAEVRKQLSDIIIGQMQEYVAASDNISFSALLPHSHDFTIGDALGVIAEMDSKTGNLPQALARAEKILGG